MNLRFMHAGLILLSAALAVLVGLWSLGVAGLGNGVASVPAGIASFAVAIGLVMYDSWFLRKTRTLPMIRLRSFAASARQARFMRVVTIAMALVIGGSSRAFACPVCFGAEETSMIDASRLGILVLLLVTFAVQGGFVAFFLYLRKRAKLIADIDLDNEWSELQGGATRT